jgi:hypothetical protein
MLKFLKKLLYKGIYNIKKVVVVYYYELVKFIFILFCFFYIDPTRIISILKVIIPMCTFLYVNIFDNTLMTMSLSENTDINMSTSENIGISMSRSESIGSGPPSLSDGNSMSAPESNGSRPPSLSDGNSMPGPDSNRSSPPALTERSTLSGSSVHSPGPYESPGDRSSSSNSAGSSYYDPNNDYGIYSESSHGSLIMGTRNVTPFHNTYYYAAKLNEDVLNINAHVSGTNIKIELSRASTITGGPGPKDLLAHIKGETVIIREAASLPQDEQREILISIKKAIFNIDMATRNARIADVVYPNGRSPGSVKSFTDSLGNHVRSRIDRDAFNEARGVLAECKKMLYENRWSKD